ncbi:hypothetical protein [Jeotgalibacillus campisalis]|uniref:Uncharacterized protein n=1 Tax=Jeotgalibacillus campisalis TaxID=220754 RepID=A0A0C2W4P8_9BACL|nr:hypothetical protein [Jeotgalibacillus campisalis]KIL50993.1 hypothetical protein KR50_08740 [Jeotgalibacillus campisalis]
MLHTVENLKVKNELRNTVIYQQEQKKKSIRQIVDGLKEKGVNAKRCKRIQAVMPIHG